MRKRTLTPRKNKNKNIRIKGEGDDLKKEKGKNFSVSVEIVLTENSETFVLWRQFERGGEKVVRGKIIDDLIPPKTRSLLRSIAVVVGKELEGHEENRRRGLIDVSDAERWFKFTHTYKFKFGKAAEDETD